MSRLALAVMLLAAGGGAMPDGPRLPRPRPPPSRGPLARSCPRCLAKVGEPCDPRTLGAYDYHLARVTP